MSPSALDLVEDVACEIKLFRPDPVREREDLPHTFGVTASVHISQEDGATGASRGGGAATGRDSDIRPDPAFSA